MSLSTNANLPAKLPTCYRFDVEPQNNYMKWKFVNYAIDNIYCYRQTLPLQTANAISQQRCEINKMTNFMTFMHH